MKDEGTYKCWQGEMGRITWNWLASKNAHCALRDRVYQNTNVKYKLYLKYFPPFGMYSE